MARAETVDLDRNRVPLYLQVTAVMRQRIETGHWPQAEQIPPTADLMAEFGAARVTIRRAISLLREEGLLSAQQGRGTFVSGRPKKRQWINFATDLNSISETIKDNVVKIASIEKKCMQPLLAGHEGKSALDYTLIRSVQYNGDEPFSVGNVYLATGIFARDKARFAKLPTLPLILGMKKVIINLAFQTVTIGVAGLETSKLLKVGLGEPTADSRIVLIDNKGVAIFVANFHCSRDCFALHRVLFDRQKRAASRP
jgi:GntR family transcriptional regulator